MLLSSLSLPESQLRNSHSFSQPSKSQTCIRWWPRWPCTLMHDAGSASHGAVVKAMYALCGGVELMLVSRLLQMLWMGPCVGREPTVRTNHWRQECMYGTAGCLLIWCKHVPELPACVRVCMCVCGVCYSCTCALVCMRVHIHTTPDYHHIYQSPFAGHPWKAVPVSSQFFHDWTTGPLTHHSSAHPRFSTGMVIKPTNSSWVEFVYISNHQFIVPRISVYVISWLYFTHGTLWTPIWRENPIQDRCFWSSFQAFCLSVRQRPLLHYGLSFTVWFCPLPWRLVFVCVGLEWLLHAAAWSA